MARERSQDTAPTFSASVREWLPALETKGKKFARSHEEEILASMVSDAEREGNPAIKQFMEDFLLGFCEEAEVLPSVVFKFHWKHIVAQERALLEHFPVELYVHIEDLLSRHVTSKYTPHGVVRYPLTMNRNRPGRRAVKNVEAATTSPSKILDAHYDFGSNTYHVGKVIQDLIGFLEKRYQLRVADLELAYQRRKGAGR